MPYKKYKNPDSRCKYPFTNDPFGYCWGFALNVDKKATKEEIKKYCNKTPCEFWKEKWNQIN